MKIRRFARSGLAALAATAVLVSLSACGDSDEGTEDAEPDDDAAETSEVPVEDDPRNPGHLPCAVSIGAVEEVTGLTIDEVEGDGGGVGSTSGFSVGWDGCGFETEDGAEVEVATLVGEDGEPSTEGYESLLAEARPATDTGPAGGAAIGEGSFYGNLDILWVKLPGATLGFALINFDEPEVPTGPLEDMAEAVVRSWGLDDCSEMPAAIPDAYRVTDAVSEGSVDNGEFQFDSCRTQVDVNGVSWDLEVRTTLGTEAFDALQESQARSGVDDPVEIDGVGDSAVRYRTQLYFRDGPTAYVVSASDADGDFLGEDVLVDLAEAVLAGS